VGCGTDISGKTGFLTTYSFSLSTGTTTVTQGSQTRTFQHDWLGRPTSVTEPESGTTTYAYTYNSTGLQVTRKKPKANQTSTSVLTTTTTQYDSVGRVLSIQYDDGTPSKYFDYDKSENWSYPQANLKGRLSGTVSPVTLSGADSIYSYDPVGRVSMVAECLPSGCNLGVAHEMDYGYDLAGNLLSSTDGAGIQSTYTVSIANELLSLTSSLNNSTNRPNILSNIQNGPFGPTGYSLGNGLTGVPWYDSAGRYNGGWVCNGSSTHNCMGGTEIQGSLAAWHGTENIQPCEDNPTANNCANAGYDEFGRLKSFASTVGAYTYQYTYDRYGNRWAQTETIGSGGPQPSLSFNSANNQISISGYAYDAAGNLIQDPSHHYTYDAEGNITQVDSGSTAKYYYNSLNQRVRTEVGSSVTEYVFNTAGQRVSIWNGSTRTQLQGQYYWGSEPVAFYSGGVQHFQHQNWLGTERVRTSYSGSVEGQYGSLPFGDGQTSSGSNPNTDAYHFADLDHDSETNTEHAYFRQFAGASGRWLSPDSYFGSYDSSNPQSLNRYTYVLESGLVYTDRLGLSANNSDCSAGDTVCVDGCDDPVASIVCISGGGFGWGGFGGGTGGGGGGTGGGGGGGASSSGTTNGQQKSPARQACEANEIAYANRVRDDYFDGTSDRILSATFTGAKAGAVSGAMRGFMGGELLEPIGGGIPGALAGGFIGGVAGAGGAVLKQGAQEMLGGYLYDHSFLGFGNTYQKQLAANIQKRCGGL
jgi:RHS repeat-associated protein